MARTVDGAFRLVSMVRPRTSRPQGTGTRPRAVRAPQRRGGSVSGSGFDSGLRSAPHSTRGGGSSGRRVDARGRRVDPRRQRIYRRRRIIVGTALVLAVALVVFCIYSLARGAGAISDVIRHDDLTAMSRNPVPSSAKSKGTGVPDCTAKDVKLELATGSQSVGVGGSMPFTMTIRYEGTSSCLIDASNASRILTITSGNDTVWTSKACPADPVMLLMSHGDKRVDTLTWNANRTVDHCVDDADLPKVDAGTYSAQLSLRDDPKAVSDKVPFLVQ